MRLSLVKMLTITTQDLAEITGRTQPAAQIRWLKARGWLFEIGGDGLPKVATAYFDRRMVLGDGPHPTVP